MVETLENVAPHTEPAAWPVTARPMSTSLAMVIDTAGETAMSVHVVPLLEYWAVNVPPLRVSLIHWGTGVSAMSVAWLVATSVSTRRW